ncbi:GNAT family N-acetyltransferase [Paenibacillus radicis (ex Gao et al. 2016)]|uniref:N-acetyltransferase YesJ n=1 Tax=Paenibacillus radicis (ex Gao et al. 2016) TaxID=1737354 RepID=A0A917M0Z1_9BACL|nr:GNAT family N-acetyltransferase [Paenibacillus radicis (ex Gao et al. 2016)]GGG69654.1 putative N-acetyltransferase YesJ [Paenibacillus radicis (ex Gao et al. 2016)]
MKSDFTIINPDIIDGNYTVSVAKKEEADEIMSLLIDTAKWLQSKGSDQWSGLLKGYDSHDTVGSIEKEEVFVCKHNNEIVGVVILKRQPSEWDLELWGSKAYADDEAIYLHRLTISRKRANSGLGSALLNWCDSAISFRDKKVVRLDCIASNPKLFAFYESNGYEYMGQEGDFKLFEKNVFNN